MNIDPLVSVVGGEPLASSFVIANGMEVSHRVVMQLVRKYEEKLKQYQTFAFQMQKSGGRPTEYVMLNERQTMFLITLMRNNEKVVDFKFALINEFYRMREALNSRSQNLYQQLQALVAEEVETKVKASFGSHLMLERKRAIPDLQRRREQLQSEIQPSLFLH